MVSSSDAREIEQFLYLEAQLLDARKYLEWLELLTEDCVYWVPNGREEVNPEKEASLIYDNIDLLKTRIARILHPMAHSQTPPSRMCHVIGNVRIDQSSQTATEVHSNFTIVEARLGEQRVFGGHCEHHLRLVNGNWQIAYKRVDLVNNDATLRNLVFLF